MTLLLSLLTLALARPPHDGRDHHADREPDPSTACDRDFFQAIHPEGMDHRPPPLRPLLQFAYDTDDSRTLDDTEQAALDADVALRCDALKALVVQLDTDGDGVISETERRALHDLFGPPPPRPSHGDRGHRPEPGQLPPPLLQAYDADGDQDLSAAERANARADIQDRFRNGMPPLPHPDRE